MAGGITVGGRHKRAGGNAGGSVPFRAARDGDHMPGTGQRVTGAGNTSDVGEYAWISANIDSSYDVTVGDSELRGTLTGIPIKAGAWQRIPGVTQVTLVSGDVFCWDAAHV